MARLALDLLACPSQKDAVVKFKAIQPPPVFAPYIEEDLLKLSWP